MSTTPGHFPGVTRWIPRVKSGSFVLQMIFFRKVSIKIHRSPSRGNLPSHPWEMTRSREKQVLWFSFKLKKNWSWWIHFKPTLEQHLLTSKKRMSCKTKSWTQKNHLTFWLVKLSWLTPPPKKWKKSEHFDF